MQSSEIGTTDATARDLLAGQCWSTRLPTQQWHTASKASGHPTLGVLYSSRANRGELEWTVLGSPLWSQPCARAWHGRAPIPRITKFLNGDWCKIPHITSFSTALVLP